MITGLKQPTDEQLKNLSRRLQLATASANLGIWDWDVKNNIMIWDDRMLELYGLTKQNSLGGVQAWQNGLHPDDRDRTIEECQAALKGEKDWDTEFRVLHPDGKVLHIKANGVVLRAKDGAPERMIGVNIDITDRKRLEDKLKQAYHEVEAKVTQRTAELARQNLKNEMLLRSASDGIHILNAKGDIIRANDAFGKLLGYSPEKMIGMNVSQWDAQWSPAELKSLNLSMIEKGRIFETTHRRRDGAIIDVEINAVGVEIDGEPTLFASARDITARKRVAEDLLRSAQSLRRSEDLLLMAQELGRTGSWIYNLETNKIWGSAEGLRIFGYPPIAGDWPIADIEDCIPERERVHHALIDLIEKQQEYNLEYMINPADGSPPRDIHSIARLEKDAQGAPLRVQGFVQDITERRKTAQDLLVAKAAAEAANLTKSAFLANMSHEIRTPLGAILGFVDLMVDPQIPPSEKANFATVIKRNGELLSNIINDILDLSKIEAGKMEITDHDSPLTEILTDTKALLELQAKDKGIALNVSVDENVPKIIRTDPLRLRQMLINIVGNAIKFTSKGTVDVKVRRVPTQNAQDLLAFVVKDTGRGIREDQIQKLFVPFSQADSTSKRTIGGTGLGLVLSRRFANLLGGDVVLTETAVDKGSTFTITIDPGPLLSAHSEMVRIAKSASLKEQIPRLEGIKVLLAEDSSDNQFLVTRILNLAGATVELASNGKEAVEKAMKAHYDVLLMDLQMPVMDGYEATAKLRKEGYRGKIIALTAHALSDERKHCLRNGFDDHVGKPVDRNLLVERVDYFSRQEKPH